MVAERFGQRVNIQPVATGTGAAQATLNLADRLEQFKTQAIGTAEESAIKRGQEQAAKVELKKWKEGITERPEFKEVGIFGRVEALAHNKSLRAAYVSSVNSDIQLGVERIKNEHPDDVIAFNEKVEGLRKGIVQGVDPSVRQAAITALDNRIGLARIAVQKNTIEKQNRIAEDTIKSAADILFSDATRASRNGEREQSALSIIDYFQNIDEQVEAGFLTVPEGEAKKREIEKEASEQNFRRELDLLADSDPKSALDRLEELNAKVPKGWEPEEWQAFIASAQTELNRKQSRNKQLTEKASKEILKAESTARGKQFADPAIPADPKDKQDRADVNNYYEEVSSEWVDLPPAQQVGNINSFIKDTGIIPDKVISGVNSVMRSGTDDQVIAFSSMVEDLRKEPRAANILRDLPDESRALSKQVFDSIGSGIDPASAIAIARKSTYGQTESEKEAIRLTTIGKQQELTTFLEDMVDKEFDPVPGLNIFGFFEEPDITPAFQADFNVAFKKFMVLTSGDTEQAKSLAFDSIKKVWGSTEVGGPRRLMKYSPEVFYGVQGVDDDWITDQWKSDLKSEKINPKKATIVVNQKTVNTKFPDWYVMTLDDDGTAVPLMDKNGNPILWSPDFTKTKEFVKLRGAKKRSVEKAAAARGFLEAERELIKQVRR